MQVAYRVSLEFNHEIKTSLVLENMLSMVLTVYDADQSCDPPTRNEVLLCNEKTDVEEVSSYLHTILVNCFKLFSTHHNFDFL